MLLPGTCWKVSTPLNPAHLLEGPPSGCWPSLNLGRKEKLPLPIHAEDRERAIQLVLGHPSLGIRADDLLARSTTG